MRRAAVRRLRRRPRVTYFGVFFEGRSGSGYLRALLATSPYVTFEGEGLVAQHTDEPQAAKLQQDAVRSLFERHGVRPELRSVGFKAKFSKVADPDSLFETLRDSSTRLVRLKRRNVVKQVVSAMVAAEQKRLTGRVHLHRGDETLQEVTIDLARFEQLLSGRERKEAALDSFLATTDVPIHHMEYADLLQRPAETVGALCEWLRVPVESLDFASEELPVKQVPDDLSLGIANYAELLAAYEGTRYEGMFRERLALPSRPAA